MTSPDSEPGYRALIPPGVPFENGVSARFINHVGLYRPGRSARKVTAPILFCICDTDAVAPAETALRYAATAPRAQTGVSLEVVDRKSTRLNSSHQSTSRMPSSA